MPFNPVEVFGVALAITILWLDIKENVLSRPLSILGALMALWVYYPAGLYATCLRKCLYIVLDSYGWYQWLYGGAHKTPLPVSHASASEVRTLTTLGLVASGVLGKLLTLYTHPALPYWDALHMVFALMAQWMLVRKKLESWVLWVILDVLYTGICYSQGLYLFSALHAMYIPMAVQGYRTWYQSYQLQKPPSSS